MKLSSITISTTEKERFQLGDIVNAGIRDLADSKFLQPMKRNAALLGHNFVIAPPGGLLFDLIDALHDVHEHRLVKFY